MDNLFEIHVASIPHGTRKALVIISIQSDKSEETIKTPFILKMMMVELPSRHFCGITIFGSIMKSCRGIIFVQRWDVGGGWWVVVGGGRVCVCVMGQ